MAFGADAITPQRAANSRLGSVAFPSNAELNERRKAPETVAMDTHLRTRMVPQASVRQTGARRMEHRCDGMG